MIPHKKLPCSAKRAALALFVYAAGCDVQSRGETHPSLRTGDARSAGVLQGPATTAVPVDMALGWCGGHGVPESVCTRCNASLIPEFKEAGDWCGGHDLPESQCERCNPGVTERWAEYDPARERTADGDSDSHEGEPAAADAPPSIGPATTGVPIDMALGWCRGHGVPESVCTRCNASLIPKFKSAGDWCGGHGLPESQCIVCNPQAEAAWQKLDPDKPNDKHVGDPVKARSDLAVERVPRLLTGKSDPVCQVDTLRVRFIDAGVAQKAGIETDTVKRRRMSAALEIPAEIEFDATRVTHVTPRLSGVVRQILVNLGDDVEAGDLLAVIDSPALGDAKSRFMQRTHDLRLAEADLRRNRTIDDGVKHMLRLCTPDMPAQEVRTALKEFPVGEAKAKLLRAHASLLLARTEAARESSLLQKGINSDRDYQAAQTALAAAEADFAALREEIAFESSRRLLAAQHAAELARSAFEVTERELHILGLTEDQVAGVGSDAHAALTRAELRSPARGRIIEQQTVSGEWTDATDVLFVVADTSTMWLVGNAYERDLLRLRKGLPIFFTVDGLEGISFEATLSWVSSWIDERTRAVRVRADLPNPDGLLRAKMFGSARIVMHDDDEVVSVPVDAVQTDGCCQLVFVRQSDTVYQPRKVRLGSSAGGFVEVLAGLSEGEPVVTVGSFLMKTEILKSNIGAGCCDVDPGR